MKTNRSTQLVEKGIYEHQLIYQYWLEEGRKLIKKHFDHINSITTGPKLSANNMKWTRMPDSQYDALAVQLETTYHDRIPINLDPVHRALLINALDKVNWDTIAEFIFEGCHD